MNPIHRLLKPALLLAAAGLFASCATVEHPKGTSKGYHSARLVRHDPGMPAPTDATERQVHAMVQKSLSKQFAAHGLKYGADGADLTVAYLVIYQEPGMTAAYPNYFGYGRDAAPIADLAHLKGTVENKRPDYFRQAGIVVDVIDSKTNKLVYRGFAKNDFIKGASAATRATRIDAAVAQALAEFFR